MSRFVIILDLHQVASVNRGWDNRVSTRQLNNATGGYLEMKYPSNDNEEGSQM